jgi:hypothetical protein
MEEENHFSRYKTTISNARDIIKERSKSAVRAASNFFNVSVV